MLPAEFTDALKRRDAVIFRLKMVAKPEYYKKITRQGTCGYLVLTVAILIEEDKLFIGFARQSNKEKFIKKEYSLLAVRRALKSKTRFDNCLSYNGKMKGLIFVLNNPNQVDSLGTVASLINDYFIRGPQRDSYYMIFDSFDDIKSFLTRLNCFKEFREMGNDKTS